jgi:hypothetical protein
MYLNLEIEEILKMKESGLNFQTQGHVKTSAHRTCLLYVFLDSKHEGSGKG